MTSPKPMTVNSSWGAVTKTGTWQVPASIIATSTMGSITLDFTTATCAHDEVEIRVDCRAGKIVLIVPDEWAVDTDRLSATGAGVDLAPGRRPQPGMPRLRITGQVTWGRLVITGLADYHSERDERAARRAARDDRNAERRAARQQRHG
ncbi:hypothetical protein OG203_33540 [Nocardia sp. NBC_01499]|uniref:hypothetical protein n=1 Tax=Nocardia sp. NBC_01499 TaxID=2903597 RepID=UPI00386B8D92